tara:strand:- start:20713 stop:21579 length:867 start_codon:yes stop_codon:yes gene_type:complete
VSTAITIDFLVPGFSKCGTTTLCSLLAQHPQLYIPELKEPWYFSADDFEQRGEDYARHFAPASAGQLLGEGSVSYSGYEKEDISISRIFDNNPHCRFVFIARNPRKRIESSFREMHNSGVKFGLNAPYALSECLDVFPQMLNDSLYFQRISKYVDTFGAHSIQVVFLEDLQRDAPAEMRRCFKHLGVDPDFQVAAGVRLNQGSQKVYDSRLLRALRSHPWTGFKLARFSPEQQDRVLRPLGLRPAFSKPVQWDAASLQLLEERVMPDSREFLAAYGKQPGYWEMRSPA